MCRTSRILIESQAPIRAINEFHSQIILLDDGFQHRRLARDLDIVLLDATEPFGFEHVFPRGTLREPMAGLRRAGVVCLSRSDLLDSAGRDTIRERVAKLAPSAKWCEAAHAPQRLLNTAGGTQPLTTLAGRRAAAFCGIGNPAAFRHALTQAGCEIVAWHEYPDHRAYSEADREELGRAAAASNAEMVICTHKDLVKLPIEQLGGRPLWCIAVEMKILAGQAAIEDALAKVIAQRQ